MTTARVSASIGVVIGLAIILVTGAIGGLSVLSHVTCEKEQVIGTALYWTPYALSNAPYLGLATYSASFALYDLYGVDHTRLTNGTVDHGNISAGYFQTENWTVFSQTNVSKSGPGTNAPCVSSFRAEQAPTSFSVSIDGAVLQGLGNTTNRGEPTNYTEGEPNRGAEFANGFVSSNLPAITTCGTSSKTLNFSSSGFDIALMMEGASGLVQSLAVVESAEDFTYYFPANAGTWQVDDLQLNPGLVGPGLAFSWQAC